ncbi:MAG: phage major capsid protein [bacterium]|nr:phage major capsid protein [bacterium]
MDEKYDFSGWATRNDMLCYDGRTIRKNAFKGNDGATVPLVWDHKHTGPENVLGHALLQNRDDGVYAYCVFNDSENGLKAKKLVQHGDVRSLSIWANNLVEVGKDVIHGCIRELSLVLAGANPGAFIDEVLAHGDDTDAGLILGYDENIMLYHSAVTDDNKSADKENNKSDDETIEQIFNSLNDKQKEVVHNMIGQAYEDGKSEGKKEASDNKAKQNESEKEENSMKHNVFEQEGQQKDKNILSHSDMAEIIGDGKRYGSLKESFLAHTADYGIENIDMLFPEYQSVNGETPQFIKSQPEGWVDTVMSGVHHTPFSRIKMVFADLREDEARAKGYMKGKLKKEEVFGLLKRTVDPTTVYKKQKLDRDDVNDITSFDVVAWLKGEMRMMLDEEIARAILFGDGRSTLAEDKISESNIIPIVADAELYTIKKVVTPSADEKLGHALITSAVKAQDDYEGSGNTTLYAASSTITDMLLLEDGDGRRMYKDMNELALAMNVNRIVRVPASIVPNNVYGVIVDLNDYNVGADKGGAVNMFDDFDIDYNQMKYLIETRCSGALTKPYSAIVLKSE